MPRPKHRAKAPRTCNYGALRVPYITIWSDEDAEIGVRFCRYVERDAVWHPQRIGSGKPLWKNVHPVRLRECVMLGLCHVCGLKMRQKDRWVHTGGLQKNSAGQWHAEEPLLCGRCAEYTKSACPVVAKMQELYPDGFQRLPPKMTFAVGARNPDERTCQRLGMPICGPHSSLALVNSVVIEFSERDAVHLLALGGMTRHLAAADTAQAA